jgi:hypothetical protein
MADVSRGPLPANDPGTWVRPAVETIVAAVVVGLILFILACAGQSYETNWIIIAALPVAFWLFFSGRVSTFKAFGLELTAAIRQASGETIKDRDLLIFGSEELRLGEVPPKGDVSQINGYVRQKISGLSFELSNQNYYTSTAIKRYLDELCQYDFFRWIIFRNRDGTFAGLVPAAELKLVGAGRQYSRLISMIEKGAVSDLPGFVGPQLALSTTDTKGQAIERFAKTDRSDLPVLDESQRFVGVLNRGQLQSRVLSSILNATRVSS